MIIDCISDLHGHLPELEGGDLLIIAGDMTPGDTVSQWQKFGFWVNVQKYSRKIFVAGNHDTLLEINREYAREFVSGAIYLQDEGTEFEGFKIWGSPWTPWFHGVHPSCKAFMRSDAVLANKWLKIPKDTDILITHGPPFGMLDNSTGGIRTGSRSLDDRIRSLDLKLHVFGHIHEAYGQCHQAYSTIDAWDENPIALGHLSVNCSIMNEHYKPVNKPIRVIL
jgi:Icc-related predicted phosphoesterase